MFDGFIFEGVVVAMLFFSGLVVILARLDSRQMRRRSEQRMRNLEHIWQEIERKQRSMENAGG